MDKKELREKTVDELVLERNKAKKDLKDITFKKVVGVVENHMQIRGLKKHIARINTIIHEKELERVMKEINSVEK